MKTEQTCDVVRETWPVTVIYDGQEQRRRALEMCDDLVGRFWAELEFDFQWWAGGALWQGESARAATEHARKARIIMLALRPEGDLDAALRHWLECSMKERNGMSGALVVLYAGQEGQLPDMRKENWLRELSRRSGLDFIVGGIKTLPGGLPATVEKYRLRADACSSVMEAILRQPQPPPFMF